MLEMIFEPCSIKATVVPTGACELTSAVFASATCAKRLPESTTTPKRLASVADGSLYGNGMIEFLRSPPGTSMSLNSPGLRGSSSLRMRTPRDLKPAGRLESVPASINCLKIDVAARDRPPIVCNKPSP